MKTFVVRLPSGDILVKTDDPCTALKVALKGYTVMSMGRVVKPEDLAEMCHEFKER